METEIAENDFIQRYDLYGCIQCGKCTGGCPVSLKSPLNIRRLVNEATLLDPSEAAQGKADLIGDCTTCETGTLRCPNGVKPSEVVIGIRGVLIEQGEMPQTVQEALESAFTKGNPFGRAKNKRAEWAADLDVKNIADGDKADMLYYVCCEASYDPRAQDVAKSIVNVLKTAGVDFGILGNSEVCCGSEMRRLGEEGLFEELAENNMAQFNDLGIKHIVTTSPHCFNALKNEYADANFEVQHYTQLVSNLIDSDRLKFTKSVDKRVTYHDPCFLGKQNKVFDEPRNILRSIPGIEFVEFDRSHEKSLCCEGGGGRMWVDSESDANGRQSEVRVRDAAEMGVDIIAVACPFCMLTLEDAVKAEELEEKIQILDISELVNQAL